VRDLLWVLYLSAKQCVSSMSAHRLHVSVSHFRLLKWNKHKCLPWETLMFISSGLCLQHPDLNQLNCKICIQIQQRIFLRKIYNVNWPTLWYGWHGFEQRIINNATDEWSKRLWVRVHVKGRRKLHVRWCYCVEYIRLSPFLIFFYISQGNVAT